MVCQLVPYGRSEAGNIACFEAKAIREDANLKPTHLRELLNRFTGKVVCKMRLVDRVGDWTTRRLTPSAGNCEEMSSNIERRRHRRDKADDSKVVLVFSENEDAGGSYLESTPIDYSAGGMQLQIGQPLKVGSLIILRTFLPDKNEYGQGRALAKVVWCHRQQDGGYRVGVAFEVPFISSDEVDSGKA